MQFHMWPSVVFTDIRLKMRTKNSQVNGSLRENVSIFWSHLLAIISRNVGTKGHLRKEIVLLKYQFFQIYDKKWWPVWTLKLIGEKHKAFDVGGLWYCSFYHPLGRFQNWAACKNMHNKKIRTGTTASASSIFTHTRIPLFDLDTTANDKSWCQALKSV